MASSPNNLDTGGVSIVSTSSILGLTSNFFCIRVDSHFANIFQTKEQDLVSKCSVYMIKQDTYITPKSMWKESR